MDAVVNGAALERAETRSAPQRRGVEALQILMARVAAILVWVEAGMERRRSRRMLMELTDSQLQDIGLSRADVAGRDWKTDPFRPVPADGR
ncbi:MULTISPECIES: DUF1127 domain-containing protein [unclassified Mesorhizobium]|uniref:DUF1127 domain-containing protein n=1 Tax=unclassified Mesorhizobium TaxID=325217 RepID=UPI001D020944|nr:MULTISPECIES: DUF1127 domain-containing protein [unclassified Mesorhizobium]UCI13826.1 DUF1127 domain-containing protein [Mesorhizobium sp. B2-1-1]